MPRCFTIVVLRKDLTLLMHTHDIKVICMDKGGYINGLETASDEYKIDNNHICREEHVLTLNKNDNNSIWVSKCMVKPMFINYNNDKLVITLYIAGGGGW